MPTSKLWQRLLEPKTLKRGWHLARGERHQDFAEDLYAADVIASNLDEVVREVRSRLSTDSYSPESLLEIEVPKGALGFRPGTVIPLLDRMVLCAAVYLLAEAVDSRLPKSVYSWRVKKPMPKKGSIFAESTVVNIPFLKRKTISAKLDPFEPWYAAWPVFDQESRLVLQEDAYRYLAVSDIAAYFENIQLPILRDLLVELLPEEHRIVNLILDVLERWTQRTSTGRLHFRGIPQGTQISSFLGNAFLLPLDRHFEDLRTSYDLRYFRYMDDVRIFTKEHSVARLAIFEMTRMIRSMHLNVQTAKTKIYDERRGEVSRLLVDPRVDEISNIIESAKIDSKKNPLTATQKRQYLAQLKKVAKRKPDVGQPILGARQPLEGLSRRAFVRWMSAHHALGSAEHVPRLLHELEGNPDDRLTRKLVRCARDFPRHTSINGKLLKFMKSENCIFPYQRAECLRAIRYVSRVSGDTNSYARKILYDVNRDPYERMQAAYLLSRSDNNPGTIAKCLSLFRVEENPYVQCALSGILVQRKAGNGEVVRELVFHANNQIRNLGRLFRLAKNDRPYVAQKLKHLLRPETPWLLCDSMPYVFLMSYSQDRYIQQYLADRLKEPAKNSPILDIRELLFKIRKRTLRTIAAAEQ